MLNENKILELKNLFEQDEFNFKKESMNLTYRGIIASIFLILAFFILLACNNISCNLLTIFFAFLFPFLLLSCISFICKIIIIKYQLPSLKMRGIVSKKYDVKTDQIASDSAEDYKEIQKGIANYIIDDINYTVLRINLGDIYIDNCALGFLLNRKSFPFTVVYPTESAIEDIEKNTCYIEPFDAKIEIDSDVCKKLMYATVASWRYDKENEDKKENTYLIQKNEDNDWKEGCVIIGDEIYNANPIKHFEYKKEESLIQKAEKIIEEIILPPVVAVFGLFGVVLVMMSPFILLAFICEFGG